MTYSLHTDINDWKLLMRCNSYCRVRPEVLFKIITWSCR